MRPAQESHTKLQRIREMYGKEKIAMLTAYDYSLASIETVNGTDIILVGDSANCVLNGQDTTRGISMREMCTLARRVANGVEAYGNRALIVADLPDNAYCSKEQAMENARALWDAGADAVKLEGATEKAGLEEMIQSITGLGIPVQGHIGFTPQSKTLIDTGHVQGKTERGITKLIEDYRLLEDAGVFSVVLECVPWQVADHLTKEARVPSIGIGSGPYCDGQVLVVYDLLRLSNGIPGTDGKFPRFVWQYENMDAPSAIQQYVHDVKERNKPASEESYALKDTTFLEELGWKRR